MDPTLMHLKSENPLLLQDGVIAFWCGFWCFHGLNCGTHRLDGVETLVQDAMPVGAVRVGPTA